MKMIFISGYTDNAIVQQDIIDRELILIQKPLKPGALVEKVRAVLDKKNTLEPSR